MFLQLKWNGILICTENSSFNTYIWINLSIVNNDSFNNPNSYKFLHEIIIHQIKIKWTEKKNNLFIILKIWWPHKSNLFYKVCFGTYPEQWYSTNIIKFDFYNEFQLNLIFQIIIPSWLFPIYSFENLSNKVTYHRIDYSFDFF